MNKQQVIQLAQQDPNVARAVAMIQQEIGDMPITSEGLDEFVQMLEFALERPEAWPEVRRAAVADGLADEEDLPENFDPTIILALLVVMYGLQQRAGQQGFRRGGLAQMARAGRGGDTMLAHVNPREAAMLRAMGGSGTINPHTGLPEYGFLKKLLKVALPIVLSFVAPGIGTAIGTALGASGTAAAMLGQAVIGGVTAGIGGGNVLKGMVLGGLTGGLGDKIGGFVNEGLKLDLGSVGTGVLGNAIVGGGSAALTGQNVLKGAALGALGAVAGNAVQGVVPGTLGSGVNAGGRMFGNMLAAGFKPKEAIIGGGLAGLATAYGPKFGSDVSAQKPSDVVLDEMRQTPSGLHKVEFSPGEAAINPETGQTYYPAGDAPAAPATGAQPVAGQQAAPPPGKGFSPMQLLAGASLLSSLGSAPQPVQQAVAQLPAAQQEYFNRPSTTFDWERMQSDASAANMDLGAFMAQNWNTITSGAYSTPVERKARGGALNAIGALMSGGGSGRDDVIDAKLSDGEYVMDAETVALLGDGSNKEGARRLDAMRQRIREHKGKTLARGKFSPNAKSPLAYLKGAM